MYDNPTQWTRPERVTSVVDRMERAALRIEATATALEEARNGLESQRGHALVDAAGKAMAGYGDVGVAVGMGAEECRHSPYVEEALTACRQATTELALLRWSLEMDDEPGPDREWEADITGHIEQSVEEAQELLEMLRNNTLPHMQQQRVQPSAPAQPAQRVTPSTSRMQWAAAERASAPAPAYQPQRARHPLALASLIVTVLVWPLGVFPGIVMGHMARRRIKRDPQRLRGATMALVSLLIGYGTIIGGGVALYDATKPPVAYESCEALTEDYPEGVTSVRAVKDRAFFDSSLAAANQRLDPGSRIICGP